MFSADILQSKLIPAWDNGIPPHTHTTDTKMILCRSGLIHIGAVSQSLPTVALPGLGLYRSSSLEIPWLGFGHKGRCSVFGNNWTDTGHSSLLFSCSQKPFLLSRCLFAPLLDAAKEQFVCTVKCGGNHLQLTLLSGWLFILYVVNLCCDWSPVAFMAGELAVSLTLGVQRPLKSKNPPCGWNFFFFFFPIKEKSGMHFCHLDNERIWF